MRISRLFSKTSKSISEETESINARLLTQAGFIRQEIAGVYNFLPLGLRVLNKIEAIVRAEMDTIGSELLMPTLTSQERWRDTGRLESVDVLFEARGANAPSRERNDATYIVNPTHEDVITPIMKDFIASYKDLPQAAYQIQTKFRNEPRAKSGLLRGREFRMKDLYSFHRDEVDLKRFYEAIKPVYSRVYERLGLGDDTFICVASGGDFTTDYSHEFQVVLPAGEDTIYLDRDKKIAYNKEVATPEDAKKLGVDFEALEEVRASEAGNIFPLGTKYSKALGFEYTDEQNERYPVWMGSYGIGTSRLMGIIAEKYADEKGLIWPEAIAPFRYYLIALGSEQAQEAARKLYAQLGADAVLYDDRTDVSAGAKFADAELIGCPIRLVLSDKTLEHNAVEVVSRRQAFEQHTIALHGGVDELARLAA
ncbi:prolyl-tRNA synthetase [Candidatus Saccharibacteria bacterium]|nr:prolyl-tRNA synthetase [Candidatus Saccharibacteria bacterium]